MNKLFTYLTITSKILAADNDNPDLEGVDKNSKLFNLPKCLNEVKSLCVAKTILNSFCKISEESARNWKDHGQYLNPERHSTLGSGHIEEEGGQIENHQITKKLERKFNEWERKISEESRELDQFIKKHENTMKGLSQNLDQKNEWLGDMVEKLEQMTVSK